MCYSARVNQNLREISKRYGADIAWESFEDLFRRRLEGEKLKVARALERNFDVPVNEIEFRTKNYIDLFNAQQTQQWENEIFVQRRRLGAAQESLKKKDTLAARESLRISTSKIETLLARLTAVKRAVPEEDDGRIFPTMFAPVIAPIDGECKIVPMRYGCRLSGKPASYDRDFPGTYNARRDNLSRFWKSVYGKNHAVMVINGFYENVPKHHYQHRELEPGEKEQNFVLKFDPRPAGDMLVACVWDKWTDADETLYSFAAVTDDPPAEVAATGHQRCVISLREDNLGQWLSTGKVSNARFEEILGDKASYFYEHVVAA